MAKSICLQAGHENVFTGATGAPGERERNVIIRNRLGEVLISKGFVVYLVDANPPYSQVNKDFDLFLALHQDANIYGTGGGCVASGDPNYDASWQESARIRDAIISEYFRNSEIVNHPERVNVKMTQYYMWSQLTAKTPCVIMEMGVSMDAHDTVLLNDTDRIANAIARGICKAFGVVFDVTPPPVQPIPPPTTPIPPVPPVVIEPTPPPAPNVDNVGTICLGLLSQLKAVISGKGFWWTKYNKIKELLK